MKDPPALPELQALAERALAHDVAGETQATAVWERENGADRLSVEVTCVIGGRAARAETGGVSDEDLRRAVRAAALHARRPRAWPTPGLPGPVPGGSDVSAPAIADPGGASAPAPPPPLPEVAGVELAVHTTARRVAIASTRGVRAAGQSSRAVAQALAHAPGRTIRLRAAAATLAGLPLDALASEAGALRLDGLDPVDLPPGELPVVLGHDAVATILDHLRPAFGVELDLGSGPLHRRLDTRVAAAAVDLATPAGGFDAEGVPSRHVRLIEAGIARRRVHDTASAARTEGAASTGHATRAAALAPMPSRLALGPGEAPDVPALCAPVEHGLYVPALSMSREADGDAFRHTTHGAVLIRHGEAATPVRDGALLIHPLAVLASVEALTAATRTIPLTQDGEAGVPALRAAGGCRGA